MSHLKKSLEEGCTLMKDKDIEMRMQAKREKELIASVHRYIYVYMISLCANKVCRFSQICEDCTKIRKYTVPDLKLVFQGHFLTADIFRQLSGCRLIISCTCKCLKDDRYLLIHHHSAKIIRL